MKGKNYANFEYAWGVNNPSASLGQEVSNAVRKILSEEMIPEYMKDSVASRISGLFDEYNDFLFRKMSEELERPLLEFFEHAKDKTHKGV